MTKKKHKIYPDSGVELSPSHFNSICPLQFPIEASSLTKKFCTCAYVFDVTSIYSFSESYTPELELCGSSGLYHLLST